jgi:hypothetical protein
MAIPRDKARTTWEVVRMRLDQAVAEVERGAIRDAKTVAGLLLASSRTT